MSIQSFGRRDPDASFHAVSNDRSEAPGGVLTTSESSKPSSSSQPLVTVGIPVYNGERFLARALDALLAQNLGDDLEVVISDNASTDRTEEICRAYASEWSNIVYSREPINRGAAYNFNRVLALARGKYFKWNAHDDYVQDGYFDNVLPTLIAESVIGVITPATYVDSGGETLFDTETELPLSPWPPEPTAQACRLIRALSVGGLPAMVVAMGTYRTATLRSIRPLGNYYLADSVMATELVLKGRVVYSAEPLLVFTRHEASSSFKKRPDPREQQDFYDPSIKSRVIVGFQYRRRFVESLIVIFKAEISVFDKSKVLLEMLALVEKRFLRKLNRSL
ncbi:MAG: glycosyltransferase family 2 protein [Dehalococcoidia bacterium]